MRHSTRSLPARLAAGAYIAHSGWEKWQSLEQGDARATGLHGMAAGAYPFLGSVPPRTFLRTLSATELALGTALCLPFMPDRLVGFGLSAFAGGLIAMYLRTPALHRPGSVWPTPAGMAISKDVWMLGIGLSLVSGRRRGR